MPNKVNGVAAANKLLSYKVIRTGSCLFYVWKAYDAVGADTTRSAPTAYDAWLKSDGKHTGDRNPPAGVPVFFGKKPSSAAGDVVISLGGGKIAVTEPPGKGATTGITTIAARQAQIGRPYLGWTECIFDQKIDYTPVGTPTDNKPSGGGKVSKLAWANGRTDAQIIKDEQSWLNKVLGTKLKVDGIRGDQTIAAIKRYQRILGAKADGVWGADTQKRHTALYNQIKKHPNIRKGAKGPIVGVIQERVGARVDNIFGNETVSKLAAYQTAHKLKRDAIAGVNTWKSLGF